MYRIDNMDFLNDTNKPAKLNQVHLLPPSCLTKSRAFPQLSMGAAGKYKWLSAPPDKTSAGLLQSLHTIDRWRWSLSLNFCCESFEMKISWKGTKLSKLLNVFTGAYMQYVYWQAGKTHFQRNFNFLDLWIEREFYWQYWWDDALNGFLLLNVFRFCIWSTRCTQWSH